MNLRNYILENYRYDEKTGKFFYRKNVAANVKVGEQAGTLHHKGYRCLKIKGREYAEHRLAWLVCYRAWPKKQIDHINLKRDDNRISNLRDVSTRENCSNRRRHLNGGLVGATWDKRYKKWASRIRVGARSKHLGYFENSKLAHEAYKKAKKDLEHANAKLF